MLLAVAKHNEQNTQKINTVVCPGLGTATGKVKSREASRQMELAYRNFINPPSKIDWDYAGKRQQEIIYGGDFF
jgi:hypothetical protein